jgi:small subunit ribosomal protein S16
VAVKIRLKRLGKVRVPQYRIVVVDSRKKRDGKVIEEIGKYHPKEDPSYIDVVSDRAQYWLGVGAQPTEAVEKILKITGDWQTFKGLPGQDGTLRVKDAKRAKVDIFNDALKDAANEPSSEAVTKKAKAAKAEPKAEAAPVAAPAAEETPAEETPAEAPAAEEAAPVPADETPEGAAEAAAAEADAEDAKPAETEA